MSRGCGGASPRATNVCRQVGCEHWLRGADVGNQRCARARGGGGGGAATGARTRVRVEAAAWARVRSTVGVGVAVVDGFPLLVARLVSNVACGRPTLATSVGLGRDCGGGLPLLPGQGAQSQTCMTMCDKVASVQWAVPCVFSVSTHVSQYLSRARVCRKSRHVCQCA